MVKTNPRRVEVLSCKECVGVRGPKSVCVCVCVFFFSVLVKNSILISPISVWFLYSRLELDMFFVEEGTWSRHINTFRVGKIANLALNKVRA